MPDRDYASEIAKLGAMREDTNMADPALALANLAMDPMFDVPDPLDAGVVSQGVVGLRGAENAPPPMDFRMRPNYEQGGMVGPGGMPYRPSYEGGGMVAPAGLAPALPQGSPQISPQMMEQEIQRLQQQRPQEIAKMRAVLTQGVQSGEITAQELNMMQQLATAAAQNPQLYPQIRQFAIQQGLGTEQTIPAQYSSGLVFALLLALRSMQGAGQPPQSEGQPPRQAYRQGGALPAQSRNRDGSIAINAHEGEYVVPAHVVRRKGTDFFDKMVESASEE